MAEYVTANTHRAYESPISSVSWAAIFAGALIAWGITFILITLGSALGFSVISPYDNSSVDMTEFHMTTGIFTVVTAILASLFGGYITGRLRTHWVGLHTNEVYFRDTAHGFLSWALATFLGAALIAMSAASVASGAVTGAAEGAVNRMDTSMMQNESAYPNRMTSTRSTTARRDMSAPAATSESSEPSATSESPDSNMAQTTTETSETQMSETAVPSRSETTGVTPTAPPTSTTADEQEAARQVAVRMSLWLTLALLAGAFTASLAATWGGNMRDRAVPTI